MNNDDRIDPRYAQSKQHAEHAARGAESEYAKFRKQEAKRQANQAGMASQYNSSLEKSATEPRQRYGQITEQVEYLENALVAQHGIIELLAEKMRPFLGNDTICQPEEPSQETLSCPMANTLRTVFERLDSHNTLLNKLIDSIET